jgi:hypothetical protein
VTFAEGPPDFENVLFPRHTHERMVERRVAQEWVWDTLREPDRIHPGNKPGRMVAEKDVELVDGSEFTLRVVYVIEDEAEALGKIYPAMAQRKRRMWQRLGEEDEPHPAAVVVTVIKIKRRRSGAR